MQKGLSGKSHLLVFHHVGGIVKDADKTAEQCEAAGMGSFEPLMIKPEEEIIDGKVVEDLRLKIRMGHIGSVKVELIEPVAGKSSIWKDVLDRKGEGIHHLAFEVDDIEEAKAEMIAKGLRLIFFARFNKTGAAAYFETQEIGGLVLELFQPPVDPEPHD